MIYKFCKVCITTTNVGDLKIIHQLFNTFVKIFLKMRTSFVKNALKTLFLSAKPPRSSRCLTIKDREAIEMD